MLNSPFFLLCGYILFTHMNLAFRLFNMVVIVIHTKRLYLPAILTKTIAITTMVFVKIAGRYTPNVSIYLQS